MSSNVMRRVQWILAAGVVCGIMTVAQADDAGRLARRRTPVVDVFETCKDAVVNITATQVFETTVPSFGLFDFFESPRPQGRTRRYTSTSLGSGFVLHADGYVVTNAHVVAQAASLKVVFADNSEHDAELVAIDESNDLAVLKVRDKVDFPALTLGRSDDLLIGETVIAIGNPLGYQHTVTSGIVSAADREVRVRDDRVLEGLIQTDASINKGNSGGPLLNALGELIGINTAIRGDAQNIGFAIPVDTLRKILPDMLSIERRKRLNIGLRLSWRGKVYITEATGPAAEAGIEPGDILLSVNDLPIVQDIDYHILMLRVDASDELRLQLQRKAKSNRATHLPKEIPQSLPQSIPAAPPTAPASNPAWLSSRSDSSSPLISMTSACSSNTFSRAIKSASVSGRYAAISSVSTPQP
mgnify:CR=1 FL=1